MEHTQRLGKERIAKLLVQFAIPAVVTMMAQAFYNIVDRIFIGRAVGAIGIAGITIAFPYTLLLIAAGTLIGVGGNSLVSIRLGARKNDDADVIFGNAITLLLGLFACITLFGLMFLDPLLRFFGATESILPHARAYMQIILFGAIFQGLGLGLNTFIRGEGNPKMAMLTMLAGVGLNTVLDPVCIFGFGLGIRGAALATVISQVFSTLWIIFYFIGPRSSLHIHWKHLALQWPVVRKILAVGSAPCLMILTSSLLNLTFNHQLGIYGGDVAISAMGVINGVLMIVLLPIMGISHGVQPIIGYNYGSGSFHRVKQALQYALAAATGIAVGGFLLTRICTIPIIQLFAHDQNLIQVGSSGMHLCFLMMPLLGYVTIGADYFHAIGKAKQALGLILCKQLVLLIPSILILSYFWGLKGIWVASPFSDALAAILTTMCLYPEMRSLSGKEIREPETGSSESVTT